MSDVVDTAQAKVCDQGGAVAGMILDRQMPTGRLHPVAGPSNPDHTIPVERVARGEWREPFAEHPGMYEEERLSAPVIRILHCAAIHSQAAHRLSVTLHGNISHV
jgi:hypothetical protein